MRTLFHSKGKSVFSAYKYSGKSSFCRDHHCHHPHPYFTHHHYYHRLYKPMLIQGPSGVYRQYHWELGEVLLELANNNTRVLLGIATTTTLHLPSSFCFHCNRHHHLHLYNHRDFFLFSKLLKPFNVSVSAVLPFLKCVFLIYVFPSERGFELLTNLRFKVVLSFVPILQTKLSCHLFPFCKHGRSGLLLSPQTLPTTLELAQNTNNAKSNQIMASTTFKSTKWGLSI